MNIKELEVVCKREKRNVPSQNWENYDLETADYLEAIAEQPEQYDILTTSLWNRMQQHRQRDLSSVPPALLRRVDESTQEWVNRCYDAGGYVGGLL